MSPPTYKRLREEEETPAGQCGLKGHVFVCRLLCTRPKHRWVQAQIGKVRCTEAAKFFQRRAENAVMRMLGGCQFQQICNRCKDAFQRVRLGDRCRVCHCIMLSYRFVLSPNVR